MKKLKILKGGLAALAANIFRGYRRPLSIYYFLTYRCPFNCLYCNITKSPVNKKELSTSAALNIIDQAAEAGTVKFQFTGGEPMLRKDIGQLIERCSSKGFLTGISTSGYAVPERINELKSADIVFLSLEGSRDIHERIRGKGTFKILTDAMEALKKAGIKFWTTTVINRINCNELGYILDWAARDGFKANFVMLHAREDDPLSCFEADDAADFLMSPGEIKATVLYIIKKKKNGYPVGTSFTYFNHILNWGDYGIQFKNSLEDICRAGTLFGHIDPDGMIYPCGTLREKSVGRDIIKLGFKEAFSGLERPFCNSCLSACQMEQNFLFSLNFNAALNWLGKLIK